MMDRVDILQSSTADMIDDLDTRLIHILGLIRDNELDPTPQFAHRLKSLRETISCTINLCKKIQLEKSKCCKDPYGGCDWTHCKKCDAMNIAPDGSGYMCAISHKAIDWMMTK